MNSCWPSLAGHEVEPAELADAVALEDLLDHPAEEGQEQVDRQITKARLPRIRPRSS
jgi:hypothetical protein